MGRKLRFFLDLLSFGSAQARAINFSLILFISWIWPTDKLQYLPVRSIWKDVLGFEPYSVGMTRAMTRLMKGDIAGALAFNKLIFIVFFVILFLWIQALVQSYKHYKKTGKWLEY